MIIILYFPLYFILVPYYFLGCEYLVSTIMSIIISPIATAFPFVSRKRAVTPKMALTTAVESTMVCGAHFFLSRR